VKSLWMKNEWELKRKEYKRESIRMRVGVGGRWMVKQIFGALPVESMVNWKGLKVGRGTG
jgi:hypothetical protein